MDFGQMEDMADIIAVYKMYDDDNFNEARDYEGYMRYLS